MSRSAGGTPSTSANTTDSGGNSSSGGSNMQMGSTQMGGSGAMGSGAMNDGDEDVVVDLSSCRSSFPASAPVSFLMGTPRQYEMWCT